MNYNKKVIEYFTKKKYVGEIKNADGVGEVGNIICGDIMKVYIKVGKKNKEEYIENIKFKTFGCVAAIASSSALAEIAIGKKLTEAIKITNKDILNKLGNLPTIKIHCSILGEQALTEAIYNYFVKNKKKIPKFLEKKHKLIMREKQAYKKKFSNR
ncbi:MAG: iron-sulfur cluster assembly scaffold protein [Candidatus Pacearchaeota archaeon]